MSLLLMGGILTFLYNKLGNYTDFDKRIYEKLVKRESLEKQSPQTQLFKQVRTDLQKNIYFNHHHQQCLEFCLKSAHSELGFEKKNRDIEIVEHLHEVTCWLQESVYFVLPDGRQAFLMDGRLLIKGCDPIDPVSWVSKDDPGIREEQVVLFLEAESAIYHYKKEQFEAKNVKLFRRIIPHHDVDHVFLKSLLITQGVAEKVEFTLGTEFNFKADKFKSSFSIKRGIP